MAGDKTGRVTSNTCVEYFARVHDTSNTETNSFLNGSTSFLIYRMEHIALGLHHIKLIKMQDDNTLPDYYIRFRVEPEVLLTQQYSLNLFQCNENNYDALQARYAKIIYRLFPTVFDHRPIINAYDIMSDAERVQFHRLESNGRCLIIEIPFEIYNQTVADFKALYNRYK